MIAYSEPERHYYDIPGGQISAVHFGRVSNPLKLVFLNANGFNAYAYKSVLEPLGVHALALDLRGHGFSQLPTEVGHLKNWHIFRDDVAAFVRAHVKRPVVIAGHSYGAVVGILAAPQLKEKMNGYVGFDPVSMPWMFRQIPKLPGGTAIMKRRVPIARKAGQRKYIFESPDAAFTHYHGRGAFAAFSDEALKDYLTGGLIPHEDGVQLACHPSWEQSIFAAQGHNLYKAAAHLPDNSCVIYAGKGGSVSTKKTRAAVAKQIGAENVSYDKSLEHLFPLQDPQIAVQTLDRAIKRAALN